MIVTQRRLPTLAAFDSTWRHTGGLPCRSRSDFDAISVRAAARRSKDGAQLRRLLTLAAIYDGSSRTEAAWIGGVTLQIVRDWVLTFNAAGPDGLIDRKAPGKPPLLNAAHRAALIGAIERGPIPAAHGVGRWRIIDLRSCFGMISRCRSRGQC